MKHSPSFVRSWFCIRAFVLAWVLMVPGGLSARSDQGYARIMQGPMLGAVTAREALIWVRTSHLEPVRVRYGTTPWLTAADTKVSAEVFPTIESDRTAKVSLAGLKPATTASLVSPLLPALGLAGSTEVALTTLAIGAGAMTVSHVNDSYFWVVTQLSGLSVGQGYRLVTIGSGLVGLTALAAVVVLRLVLV